MWKEYCVAVLLGWNAWTDLRCQEVSVPSLGIAAAAGILLNLFLEYQKSAELLAGAGIGIFLLAVSAVSKGAVGFGDGLLVCVTGIFLGGMGNLRLLMLGSVLCAAVLGTGLIFGKARWKQRFPFVPFLFLAQIGRILWE